MEPVIGRVAEEKRLVAIGALVIVVAEFVVDRGEVLIVDVDAHLDADVFVVIDVPGGSVADDFAIAGLHELRTGPECRRQRCETERREKALAITDHLLRIDLAIVEDFREIVAGIRAFGREHRIQRAPVLRPHVAEQMRGDGSIGGDHLRAVLFAKLVAHVGVQAQVERLHLFPQPVDFFGVIGGRHVVLGSPHGAGVRETNLTGALVGKFDVALEGIANRFRDGVPAGPGGFEFLGIRRLFEDFGGLVEVEAGLAVGRTILALAVDPFHLGEDPGKFRRLLLVRGGGNRKRQLQQQHLPGQVRRQVHAVESRGLLDQLRGGGHPAIVGLCRDALGVVGDVGGADPVGQRGIRGKLEQLRVRALEELLRLSNRWFRVTLLRENR